MIISGTNISTMGMKVLNVQGLYNLPAVKKTTRFRDHDAAKVYAAGKLTVHLLGRGYASAEAMATAVNNLAALIKGNTVHAIELVGHNESFNGVFANGFTCTLSRVHKVVQIKATITIAQ